MSISDLKSYIESVKTDPEVKAAANAIGMSDLQGQIEFAQTLGYAFGSDDMLALARQQNPSNGELSEAELASVSGGFSTEEWEHFKGLFGW